MALRRGPHTPFRSQAGSETSHRYELPEVSIARCVASHFLPLLFHTHTQKKDPAFALREQHVTSCSGALVGAGGPLSSNPA